MEAVIQDIKQGYVPKLVHPPAVHDTSVPSIPEGYHVQRCDEEHAALLHEVKEGVPLRHVAETSDRSAPVIEPVHVEKSNKVELLTEIQAKGAHSAAVHELKHKFLEEAREGGLPLRHVVDMHDASAPKLSPDVHVSKSPLPELLAEVREPFKFLNHVEHVNDRSAPVIDETVKVHIGQEHAELMRSIQDAAAQGFALKHIEPEQGAKGVAQAATH